MMTGYWLMIVGTTSYVAGLFFFRRPRIGIEAIRRMALWRAGDYLTMPGIYLSVGGWLLFMIGAVWGFAKNWVMR